MCDEVTGYAPVRGKNMRHYFGIDFGTSTSSIAFTTDKSTIEPELIALDGKKVIVTAIRLTPKGDAVELLGAEAWEYFQDEPERTFAEFKMDVGLGKQYVRPGFTVTPEEVAVFFLRFLREKIEKQLGRTSLAELDRQHGVTTVIGYPAEWSKAQKAAVTEVAEKAGFPNVEGGVEPVGAIYYHAMNDKIDLKKEQKAFVYDFGGGTTDTAIVAMSASLPPHVYDFDGLTELGGRNYDAAIIENVFKPLLDCDSYTPSDLAEFQRKAQSLKEKLSARIRDGFDKAEVTLSGLNCRGGSSRSVAVTRTEFETMQKASMGAFLKPVESTLRATGFTPKDIDLVIATGGSAQLYFVYEKLKSAFPDSLYLSSNSSQEVIAKGLALFACRASSEVRGSTHLAENEVVPDVEVVSAPNAGRRKAGGASGPSSEKPGERGRLEPEPGGKNPFASSSSEGGCVYVVVAAVVAILLAFIKKC